MIGNNKTNIEGSNITPNRFPSAIYQQKGFSYNINNITASLMNFSKTFEPPNGPCEHFLSRGLQETCTMLASDNFLSLSLDTNNDISHIQERRKFYMEEEYAECPTPALPYSKNEIKEPISPACSQNDQFPFSQDQYDNIEDFLDNEGLFIISPTFIKPKFSLKPCVNLPSFSRLASFEEKEDRSITLMSSDDLDEASLPTFLIRRSSSRSEKSKNLTLVSEKENSKSKFCAFLNEKDQPFHEVSIQGSPMKERI